MRATVPASPVLTDPQVTGVAPLDPVASDSGSKKTAEMAATIAFLASDGAGYITGQNLRVDGGITRSV